AELLNYTSFMALFSSRYGTQYLPFMYLLEAFLLPFEGWLLSWASERMSKPRFMSLMYLLFLAICLVNGFILFGMKLAGANWMIFYPILFISSNFVVRQQTLLMWSTAFDLCPTQQAKRVMPVFVSMAIVGGIAAGVLTKFLAPVWGTEAIYCLGPLMLAVGFPNFRKSLRRYLLPLTMKETPQAKSEAQAPSTFRYIKETFRSPFLLIATGIMTLMPALYFIMEYQYFTTARTVFENEDSLTSFYGLMVILLFVGAFLLQLVSSKLMNKLGASNMLIAISVVFALSFVLVTMFIRSPLALAAVAIGYSFTYLLLYYFAEPSYQLFFKMLPLQKRDGFRFTAQSIAASTGILLGSGLSMLHSNAGVSLFVQAFIGVVLAVVLTSMAWGARTLYVKMLIGSLESGAAHVKDALQELLGTLTSGRLGKALTEQLRHPDESVREIAIELLQKSPDLARTEELLRCCEDSSPRIRVAALQAIHPAGWLSLAEERRRQLLADPDANARAVVYRGLFMADTPIDERQRWIDMACSDENPEIRAMALMAMSEAETAAGAERMDADVRRLLEEGGESAVAACGVIGDKKLNAYFINVLMLFGDPRPYVKFAAVRAIGKLGGEETAKELLELMVGAETELRSAIRDALTELGAAAIPALHRALPTPNWSVWETAALVLGAIGSDSDIRHQLVPSCVERLAELQEVHRYSALIEERGGEEWLALAAGRTNEIRQVVLDAVWKVMVRFSDERAVPHIRLAIEGEEEEVRDNGMEVLSEGLGDARLSAALLAYYRYDRSVRQDSAETPKVTDGWLQAIAIKSGAVEGDEFLMSRWEYLSALDKMVFLKQVPLFERISVEELSRVATIAQEKIYEDGDYLVKQGETGIALVAIVEGHVELSGQDSLGNVGTIGVLGPKQSFGESALFDDRPSLISAQALFDQVRTLRIESGELSHLVRLYPDIGVGLLRASGDRIRTLEQLILKLG
ncbi:MAG: hypothetical protein K0R75_2453, partial [Paenibacillaceae bacterium]|nr:hypothetical protein [Paenibacillaceae bacterium]